MGFDVELAKRRFLTKVEGWGRPDGCWLWSGTMTNGYGVMALPNRGPHIKAHILSFILEYGPVPVGKVVCHHCNVKLCVRPSHLYAGTQLENIAQAKADGLILKGEASGRAKLTADQVVTIRSLMVGHPPKGKRAIELGALYGVDRTTIGAVVSEKTWRN